MDQSHGAQKKRSSQLEYLSRNRFGMLAINRLPRFNNPVFESERFARVTDDRFFISIDASDPLFDAAETQRFAESLGGLNVEAIGEVDDAEA